MIGGQGDDYIQTMGGEVYGDRGNDNIVSYR